MTSKEPPRREKSFLTYRAASGHWPREYQGQPRLIVPTVRSVLTHGETLTLKIIALDKQPVKSVSVSVRPLGKGEWTGVLATHVARADYEAKLPVATEDFEYYITAETSAGNHLVWPATAPEMNQTVVVALTPS